MTENTPGTPRDPNEPGVPPERTPTDPYAPRPSEPDPTVPRPSDPEPILPDPVRPEPTPGTPEPMPQPVEPEPFPPPGGPPPKYAGGPADGSSPGEPPYAPGTGTPADRPAYGSPPASGMGPSSGGPYGETQPGASPGYGTAPGYGTTPPGAAPGYPAMPTYGGTGNAPGYGASVPFTVGEAFGFAWKAFKANAVAWILYVVILAVVNGAFNSGQVDDYQEQLRRGIDSTLVQTGATVGATLLAIVGAILSAVLQALAVRAALKEVSGEKPTLASFFSADRMGTVVLAAVLVAVLTYAGLIACVLPGLAVIIFATFTYHNVHDKGLNAWDALTASFRLVAQNFGQVFLLLLASLGVIILGAIPCGLGLLVAIPLVTIAIAYAFRRITGGPVAVLA